MKPIDIEIIKNAILQNIAVNNALLKHGIKVTLNGFNKECQILGIPEVTKNAITATIHQNLIKTGEIVSFDVVYDYLLVAICAYVLDTHSPVAYLHYLASDENTKDEFIKIENEVILPLGGTRMDQKEYKKAAQEIIVRINQQNEVS